MKKKITAVLAAASLLFAVGAMAEENVALPGARVEKNARVIRAIVGESAVIEADACFCGGTRTSKLAVIGDHEHYKGI